MRALIEINGWDAWENRQDAKTPFRELAAIRGTPFHNDLSKSERHQTASPMFQWSNIQAGEICLDAHVFWPGK